MLCTRPRFDHWVRKIPWRRDRLPTQYSWTSLVAQTVKTCNARDLGSISGLERSPGEGNSYPLQYSCLENATKSQHNWATFKGFPGGSVSKWGRSGFHLWFWKIPWRTAWQPTPEFLPGESPWSEEPGGLQFTGSQRVGHD